MHNQDVLKYIFPHSLRHAMSLDLDFSGQNLCGRSFKGQDLTNANFSYADIRGADFTKTILIKTNFSHIKAGLQRRWIIIFIAILIFTTAVSAGISVSTAIGTLMYSTIRLFPEDSLKSMMDPYGRMQGEELKNMIAMTRVIFPWISLVQLVLLAVFYTTTLWKGLIAGLKTMITIFIVIDLIGGLIGGSLGVLGVLKLNFLENPIGFLVSVLFAFSVGLLVGVGMATIYMAFLALLSVVLALGVTFLQPIAVAGISVIAGSRTRFLIEIAALAIAGFSGYIILFQLFNNNLAVDYFSILLSVLFVGIILTSILLSNHIGKEAIFGNSKYIFILAMVIAYAAKRGTSFQEADLTDSDFTQAQLKNTNFRAAILKRTCFFQSRNLNYACMDKTYLESQDLQQLVMTGFGQNKNFNNRQDLRGINLSGANLADISFMGTDLSGANLQDTDLSKAKLVQTQLDGTDLTGATLTGAIIQDWGITSHTKLNGVRCKYIYMRLPTEDDLDPCRKPDNNKEVFEDGDFADFIKPIFDTLDLYHNRDIDPRAIAISFKQLAENHPDAELEIVAIEKRGQDKFLLRAKTAATADKSELSAEYFDTYNEIKSLPEREIKLLLAEKDSRIHSLENFVNQALQRPSYYSNIKQVDTMANNPGGFSVGGSVGGNVNNVQGDNNRAVQGDNNQAVLGDNNQVTQQNQVGVDTRTPLTKENVVKLLAQLETLIHGAELPADTKKELTEDLNAAKNATDKEEPNKKRALERLTSVAETLDKTSKSVEAGQKIWTTAKPIIVKIATWLGAAAGSHLLGL
ncbi:pentapeptide repeat-containing protein [Nostoc sp.]|uniref:pentapeptide repeat-containing protein n=1 Tax=Nostoc sp. TaxID=1180 RepID=UPI00359369A5